MAAPPSSILTSSDLSPKLDLSTRNLLDDFLDQNKEKALFWAFKVAVVIHIHNTHEDQQYFLVFFICTFHLILAKEKEPNYRGDW